jgi:hypothetical protein
LPKSCWRIKPSLLGGSACRRRMAGKQEEMKSEVVLVRHVCFSSSCACCCLLMSKLVFWVHSFCFCWFLGALGIKLRILLSLSQAGWVRRRDCTSLSPLCMILCVFSFSW